MPVFLSGVTVAHNVAYYLRIYFGSSVETERSLNFRALKVAVNGLRTADNLYSGSDSLVILCQYASVGVRVVTADDYKSLDVESLQNLQSFVKLVFLLKLCASGTDDVEATSIAVLVNDVGGKLYIVVIYKSTRTKDESEESVFRIKFLYTVKQTRYDVVSAGSLTS